MDNDPIELDRASRRMKSFGFIVIFVLVLAILLFLWGTFINRGTLAIVGDAPFTVEIFGGEVFVCELSPCEIKQKRGLKDLLIRKEGYETIVTTARVKLWQSVGVPVEFQIIPQIIKTDFWPEVEDQVEYELVLDSKNGMQKLIKTNNERQTPVVYFPDSLNESTLIGSPDFVLIMSGNDVYKVDVKSKTRNKIQAAFSGKIASGKWSIDGKYIALVQENSPYIWLLDESGNLKQLDLIANIDQVAWIYDNSLIFATDQSYRSTSQAGQYGNSYFELLAEKSTTGFTFGTYHPDEDAYSKIETFTEISAMPWDLTATATGDIVYFRSGDSEDANFRIILRKF